MLRRLVGTVLVGVAALGLSACGTYSKPDGAGELGDLKDYSKVSNEEMGAPLYPPSKENPPAPLPAATKADPLVLPDCRLTVYEREEVPAQQDGVILCIGTELKPEDPDPPADRLYIYKETERTPDEKKDENPKPITGINKGTNGSKDITGSAKEAKKPKEIIRRFRLLKEDDYVEEDQMMAILDDRLARDDLDIKTAKVKVSEKDWQAAEKTRDEAYQRYLTQLNLESQGRATSIEDRRAAKLLWDKSTYEAQSKDQAQVQATLEKKQSGTLLQMHEIRPKISGVIKTIYKKKGESVRKYEAVFQVINLRKLRAEGLLDGQYVSRAKVGLQAVVEPSESVPPDKTMGGHFYEITGVATGQSKEQPVIVSCDETTVRVWNRSGIEFRSFSLPRGSAGRAVACSPAKADKQFCICGSSDGVVRIWDLNGQSQDPMLVLKDEHRGAVSSIAVSPDGRTIATGGDDRMICLWNADSGQRRFKLEGAHRGPVTFLQFTPKTQLISAARDNTLKVWSLGEKAARMDHNFGPRTGDVIAIGANSDGTRLLFDEGKKIRVIALPRGETESEIQNEMGPANFSTMALYSPDGALIVSTGGSEGRLQLWRAPTPLDRRGAEVRQLVPCERTVITNAAFSQDGTFLAAAGKDKRLRIWPIPNAKDIDQRIAAQVTRVEPAIEIGGGQVRVWADFETQKPSNKLMPGMPVTLTIKPGE